MTFSRNYHRIVVHLKTHLKAHLKAHLEKDVTEYR